MPGGRRPLVAANWKMHKTRAQAEAWVAELAEALGPDSGADVLVAPALVHVALIAPAARAAGFAVAGQTCHFEIEGAFTGEVSAPMLRDAGASAVLVGHSERRAQHGEDEAVVRRKLEAAVAAGLVPVLCIGETLEEREAGGTRAVLERQLESELAGVALGERVAVAYEPVWAIGSGRTPSGEDTRRALAAVRAALERIQGAAVARAARLLYGGSVTPGNVAELLAGPGVDGALVGGASLEAGTFAGIVRAAAGGGTS